MRERSPAPKTRSSSVLLISLVNRTQRRQRMQRSWSKTTRGPIEKRFTPLRRGLVERDSVRPWPNE